ncbi:hypothetical protein RhiLY_04023 [Ceratobasidium sp. AG-Ba]|nr:hypothetical protein RhiLY_04023 [Ceratobasidium sp. AG-Ba]
MPPKRKAKNQANGDTGDKVSAGPNIQSNALDKSLSVTSPSTIASQDIEDTLSRYDDHIQRLGSKSESKLVELDDWRLNQLPGLVRARDPMCLDKEEIQRLMEWKLSRGKFRPTLSGLIAQNASQAVKASTQTAFSALSRLKLDDEVNKGPTEETLKSFRTILKELCASLKGVGPATASLVLSVYDIQVPFMSDEAYIWAMYADEEAKSGKIKSKREIKYTEKGYMDFAVRMWEIAAKANRTPGEMERVGWVLGKEWVSDGNLSAVRPGPNPESSVDSSEKTLGEDVAARRSKRLKQ